MTMLLLYDCVESEKCTLFGTHGRTGLSRLLLGSIAEEIMRKAPCPVLTVRLPFASIVNPVEEEPTRQVQPTFA
jgi:hypothetical protein